MEPVEPQEPQSSSSPSPPPSSNNDSEVDDKDPDLSWEDIVCLYCDQSIQIHRDKPGQNKKKYQQHLLSHFSDTQYADVPDGVRMYQCGYRDCGYCSGHKNHYLQHIAGLKPMAPLMRWSKCPVLALVAKRLQVIVAHLI